jgi:hypothetical protein
MTTLLTALLLAFQPTSPPAAAVAPVKQSYREHRAPSCAEWRTARSGRGATPLLEALYNIWFHGYVTGFNVHGPDPEGDLLGTATWKQVSAVIDDDCARNPSHLVADALEPLAMDLIKRRPAPTGQRAGRRAFMTVRTTCGEWNRARNDKLLRVVFGGAARGYLTAYNRWGPDPTGDVLGPGNDPLIDEWLDSWCREHSPALLLQGMAPLVRHLAAERAAGRLAPGSVPANEQLIPTVPGRR